MYRGDFENLTTDDQFGKDVAKKFQTLDLRLSSQDIAIDDVKSEVKTDVAAKDGRCSAGIGSVGEHRGHPKDSNGVK